MPITLGAVLPYATSLLGGMFGKGPKMTQEQKMLQQIAKQLQSFAGSVPMGDPQEQAALSQAQGLLGQQQRQGQEALFAAMSPMSGGFGNAADAMRNLQSDQTAQRMALQAQAMQDALGARRQALMQAANVAQGVGPPQQPGQNFSQLFGTLAELMARNKASVSSTGGGAPNTAKPGGLGAPISPQLAMALRRLQMGGGAAPGAAPAAAAPAGAPALGMSRPGATFGVSPAGVPTLGPARPASPVGISGPTFDLRANLFQVPQLDERRRMFGF